MLRAGPEGHWGYSPGRLFSDLPPREWMQGWESHPPSPAYETGQSTGSPCVLEMKPWSACDDSTYPPNLWRSDPLSCRAWHTRSMKMARRAGIAPTSAGFGGPCIACLPPPCWLMDCCPTMKGHRGGHTTVSGFPRTHATYSSPPALCALSWLVIFLTIF